MLQQREDGIKLRMQEIFGRCLTWMTGVFHRFLWRKNQHDLPTMYQCRQTKFWRQACSRHCFECNKHSSQSVTRWCPSSSIWTSRRNVRWRSLCTQGNHSRGQAGNWRSAWKRSVPDQSVAFKQLVYRPDQCYIDLLGHSWDKQEYTFALKKDSHV